MVETLIAAAKNKKKVIVVIELLARFDEASNIYWSKKMQDAGVPVIFGVEGLKIHSKITWIQTLHGSLSVIGTGNFHEGNAKAYTDCMLFTASSTACLHENTIRIPDSHSSLRSPGKNA